MSAQMITSDLLMDLSIEEQQLLSGGRRYDDDDDDRRDHRGHDDRDRCRWKKVCYRKKVCY